MHWPESYHQARSQALMKWCFISETAFFWPAQFPPMPGSLAVIGDNFEMLPQNVSQWEMVDSITWRHTGCWFQRREPSQRCILGWGQGPRGEEVDPEEEGSDSSGNHMGVGRQSRTSLNRRRRRFNLTSTFLTKGRFATPPP